MNIIRKEWDNFNVSRKSLTSVRCETGIICVNGQYYDVAPLVKEGLVSGSYSAWLKQTWNIQRNIKYCALEGIETPSGGDICGVAIEDEYVSPEFTYVVGKEYSQVLEGQEALQTTLSELVEIFYSKVADITVTNTSLSVENLSRTMVYVPVLKETGPTGEGD